MATWTGRITLATSGNQTFTLGSFTPTAADFRVTGVSGKNQLSLGGTDGTRQNCGSVYGDTSGSESFDDNTKCVSVYDRVGGAITEVLKAQFVSFGSGTVTLNVVIPNSVLKVTVTARS